MVVIYKLYYANWCPHCVNFKPTWNKFKEIIEKNGGKMKNNKGEEIKIEAYEYEDGDNKEEVQKAGVSSFPTILIQQNNDKPNKFTEQRNISNLFKQANIDYKDEQKGGFNGMTYYGQKYLFYKNKYVELKASQK